MLSLQVFAVALLGLVLVPTTFASSFQPNCTLPPSHTNFVSGPNIRGTMTILWNCISVILLCTWNIQHLNIPLGRPYYDENGKKYGCWRKAWWKILDSRTKITWMLLTVLAPEYIMGKAFSDYLAATYLLPKLREEFGAHIELIHAYFMNMGGYYLDFSQVEFSSLEANPGTADLVLPNPVQGTRKGTQRTNIYKPRDEVDGPRISNLVVSITPELEHKAEPSHCAVFQELVDAAIVGNADGSHQTTVLSTSIINRSLMRHKYWTLTAFQLLKAKRIGLATSLPEVAAQDLEKMTSGDATAKALAIIQISWLVLQLVTRGVVHLPSSQLEIATLAFSVSSMVTYGLLWECPRGIEYRFSVPAERTPTIDDVRSIGLLGRRYL